MAKEAINLDEQLGKICEYIKLTTDMIKQIASTDIATIIENVEAANDVAYKIIRKDPTALENPRFATFVTSHTNQKYYDMINANYKKSITR